MSTPLGHDDVVPAPGRSRRGGAVAATALAAVLLMGIGLGPAAAGGEAEPPPRPGSGVAAPERIDFETAQRLLGVAQDLAEAVTHGEITTEQAEKFLRQVCERLAS
ncbi:hypothetical protein RCG67_03115 [Kocuria sp. CPCC 205292]|uniref:hypothetical protein n=1 Tax=Kocuria cellulosilytica TaxID=3071451 RepID=UPI0034D59583